MSHSSPNVNLPKVKHSKDGEILYGMAGRYGFEFRSLFVASLGKVMVGADLAGLELRMLANRMWRWDNGEYARVILEGDVHSENMKAAGLDCRDKAKTFIYAFLYGAGNAKIGKIVGGTAKDGAALRAKFLAGLPALDSLLKYVKWRTKKYGTIALLDGRLAPVRSDHMALNTQLQGDGAIVAKVAYALACP
jgi:DNA polymerase I